MCVLVSTLKCERIAECKSCSLLLKPRVFLAFEKSRVCFVCFVCLFFPPRGKRVGLAVDMCARSVRLHLINSSRADRSVVTTNPRYGRNPGRIFAARPAAVSRCLVCVQNNEPISPSHSLSTTNNNQIKSNAQRLSERESLLLLLLPLLLAWLATHSQRTQHTTQKQKQRERRERRRRVAAQRDRRARAHTNNTTRAQAQQQQQQAPRSAFAHNSSTRRTSKRPLDQAVLYPSLHPFINQSIDQQQQHRHVPRTHNTSTSSDTSAPRRPRTHLVFSAVVAAI